MNIIKILSFIRYIYVFEKYIKNLHRSPLKLYNYLRSSEIRAYGRFDGFYYPRGIKHNPLINSNKSYKNYILTEIKVNVVEKHYYGLF